MIKLQLTTAQYAAIISTVAFLVSGGSLYVSKRSYDLSAARDQREIRDKLPAIDVQMRPDDVSSASAVISIVNRGDINIVPLDIAIEHSFELGDLYLSSTKQSVDRSKTALSLSSIGTLPPKGIGKLKARVSGATDGKADSFTPGAEFNFRVRIRFADEQDTIKTFRITRRVQPPLAVEPCPPSWTLAPQPTGCELQ